MSKKNSKNYWPAAIVGIIAFGMCIVAWGVYIALSNPAIDDLSYGAKKRVVDEQINELLIAQKEFEAQFVGFVDGGIDSCDVAPCESEGVIASDVLGHLGESVRVLKSPYARVIKPRVGEDTLDVSNQIFIFFKRKRDADSENLRITRAQVSISDIRGRVLEPKVRIFDRQGVGDVDLLGDDLGDDLLKGDLLDGDLPKGGLSKGAQDDYAWLENVKIDGARVDYALGVEVSAQKDNLYLLDVSVWFENALSESGESGAGVLGASELGIDEQEVGTQESSKLGAGVQKSGDLRAGEKRVVYQQKIRAK